MNLNFMKITSCLTALIVSLSLFCSKANDITLAGQAFVVTRGAESIKFGLIEVWLIKKQSATEFIQNKQPAIDSGMASRQQDYDLAKMDLNNTNSIKISLDDSVLVETNYQAMLKEREALIFLQGLSKQSTTMLRGKAGVNSPSVAGQLNKTADQIESKQDKEENKIRVLSAHIASIEEKVSEKKTRLDTFPPADIYFENFSPSILQKTLTDADGKFSFSYRSGESLTLFAKAERVIGDKTEKYYWMVNAPSEVEKVQLFLSNKNVVTVDPDGYFKTKPKSAFQE